MVMRQMVMMMMTLLLLPSIALVATIPSEVISPVQRQLYPKMIQHIQEFGNPNIPLGSSEGRQCETLRRLHVQKKLTDAEVYLLTELGFCWHDFEDVYKTVDFDELFTRLLDYRDAHDGDFVAT